jgi:putative aminopeptidase FrvX
MFDLLKKLVDSDAVSGYEEKLRKVMEKDFGKHVDEIRTDKVGNLIARKGKGSPKIMIAAHMDKIGLIVKHVNKEGFLHFDKLGGWDDRILPTNKVIIHGSKGPVFGVLGTKPIHIQDKEELKKVPKTKEMFIDIGAKSEGDVKKAGICVGDFITIYGSVQRLMGTRVTGQGFDDRIGCLVMIETAKRLRKFKGTVYFVGTIREELGLIGIRSSTYSVNPDALLAIDTNIAGDMPGMNPEDSPIKLSEGPALDIKDAISVVSPEVKKWVQETAKKSKIKLQYIVMEGSATDASLAPSIREGVPSGAITVPSRYIHTPVEVADMKDVEDCVKLCVKLVENAHKYF